MKCVLIAGGALVAEDILDGEIESADFVICADRGYEFARNNGIKPDLIVGDFDSYSGDLPDGIEIYRTRPEKDDTDTITAVRMAIDRGCDSITLYGALGGRFDHAFANVQTLLFAHERGCRMTIRDSRNVLTVYESGEHRFPRVDGWYLSVFALTEKAMIGELSGVKYPLYDYPMTTAMPIGVSNEITEESAYLRLDSGMVLIVRAKM